MCEQKPLNIHFFHLAFFYSNLQQKNNKQVFFPRPTHARLVGYVHGCMRHAQECVAQQPGLNFDVYLPRHSVGIEYLQIILPSKPFETFVDLYYLTSITFMRYLVNSPIFAIVILINYYVRLYVFVCDHLSLCVFYLVLVDFGLRRVFQSFQTQGYFDHLVSKGKIVLC